MLHALNIVKETTKTLRENATLLMLNWKAGHVQWIECNEHLVQATRDYQIGIIHRAYLKRLSNGVDR